VPEGRVVSFASPFLLVSLLVPLAALAGYLWLERRPPRYVVTYPNVGVLAQVAGRRRPWRRHLVAALLLLALSALCVGLARPKVTMARPSERATVVLVVDVSVSMNATDVKPSRLDAAREAITRFVDQVPRQIRVALVGFSDSPEVITPPTTDRSQLHDGIAVLTPGFGTAIGDAVARGVELARSATGEVDTAPADGEQRVPSAVVLLSDGTQTRGLLTPDDGARRARRAGVPVHTIALGTLGGVVTVNRDGFPVTVPVPPDRATLARIAETTGGKTFEVTDAKRLSAVYEQLGSVVGRERRPREVTVAFLAVGAALLAAATALAGLWAPRLP
jgi:Ca-activated chloride channel family protein